MKYFFTLILLSLPSLAYGQSVTLPIEVKGAVGAWIIIAPEKIDGGTPKWRIDPGLQEVRLDLLLPPEMLKQLKGKVVTANQAGKYKIECWNAKADQASDIATCWIVIGNPTPVPPGPGPGPIPVDDPIVKAWLLETATDKKDAIIKMALCYEAAANIAATANTWGELMAAIKNKATEQNIVGKLPNVSKAVNAQLVSAGFPASPSVLITGDDASKAKTALTKIVNTLRTLQ